MKVPTACKACVHFLNTSISDRTPVWHEMLCKAFPLPLEFNPYNGKKEPRNPQFKFCRDVNFGTCPKFECRHIQHESIEYVCANCGEEVKHK